MSSGRPRVLVVAYDFPPHAAIGTMRTLRVVRRLAAEGWDVTVLTGHPRTYRPGTPVDEALIQQVPAGVRIVRAPAVRAFEQMKRLATGRRRPASDASRPAQPVSVAVDSCEAPKRNVVKRAVDLIDAALAIPDNESAWLLPAIAAGVAAATTHAPEVLYSSAPPWTSTAGPT